MATLAESACWRALACSEAPASYRASAASHRFPEDIGVLAVVKTKLKLREIQRQILRAYVVIGAHHSTLQERPEILDVVGVYLPTNVLACLVIDGLMLECLMKLLIARAFIGRDEINFVRHHLAD